MAKFIGVGIVVVGFALIALGIFAGWDLAEWSTRSEISKRIVIAWSSTAGSLPVYVSARPPIFGDGYIGAVLPTLLGVLGWVLIVAGWKVIDAHYVGNDEDITDAPDPVKDDLPGPEPMSLTVVGGNANAA